MRTLIQKIKSWLGFKDVETFSTGKILVHFSDNMLALADNHDEAQALVMQRSMNSMEPVYADFYEATPEDVQWFIDRQEGEA